jgi:hypothetical protein
LRGTSFGPPKELLLDLNRDLIQPPFSPLCPFLMVAGMGLKFSYPIFSGAKLSRSLARHFDGRAAAHTRQSSTARLLAIHVQAADNSRARTTYFSGYEHSDA